ncbi:mechanosensitive ion channel family protein [Draconibacterium sp.]|jgi:small-conductance mechanosensitive channel
MNFDWSKYFNAETIDKGLRIGIIVLIGLFIISMLEIIVKRILPKRFSQQRKMLINRFVRYTAIVILFLIIISELDINLTAIFGAAGVIGIVIGVASQSSIGNIVSGFFLISEKPFEMGDLVRIGDKTGTVYSIDLLSIKIKTPDNLLLRIPNQTVISTEVINVTKFPIRRLDIDLSVAYKEDLGKVMEVIKQVVKRNPFCLDEPEPLVLFKDFGASGINILLGVWFEKANLLKVKNSLFIEIKSTFDAEGIEIPFPHVSIYAGEATKPFPMEVKLRNKE